MVLFKIPIPHFKKEYDKVFACSDCLMGRGFLILNYNCLFCGNKMFVSDIKKNVINYFTTSVYEGLYSLRNRISYSSCQNTRLFWPLLSPCSIPCTLLTCIFRKGGTPRGKYSVDLAMLLEQTSWVRWSRA